MKLSDTAKINKSCESNVQKPSSVRTNYDSYHCHIYVKIWEHQRPQFVSHFQLTVNIGFF